MTSIAEQEARATVQLIGERLTAAAAELAPGDIEMGLASIGRYLVSKVEVPTPIPHQLVAAAYVLAGLPVPERDPAEVERERLIETAAVVAAGGDNPSYPDPYVKALTSRLVDAGWRPPAEEVPTDATS